MPRISKCTVGAGCDSALVIDYASRVRGCLLGGAIGDALGAPVEFMSAVQIESLVGGSGSRRLPGCPVRLDQVPGLITDDTQMTLFTVDGIIRAINRERTKGLGFTAVCCITRTFGWLDTQQLPEPSGLRDGWLQATSTGSTHVGHRGTRAVSVQLSPAASPLVSEP